MACSKIIARTCFSLEVAVIKDKHHILAIFKDFLNYVISLKANHDTHIFNVLEHLELQRNQRLPVDFDKCFGQPETETRPDTSATYNN